MGLTRRSFDSGCKIESAPFVEDAQSVNLREETSLRNFLQRIGQSNCVCSTFTAGPPLIRIGPNFLPLKKITFAVI